MRIYRRTVERRATSARNFRRLLYGAIGLVLSSYLILFILVVSRHLDRSAEAELRRSAAEAVHKNGGKAKIKPPPREAAEKVELKNSPVGTEKMHERWAAVARILASSGMVPAIPRRRVRMCNQPKLRNPPGHSIALASFPGSGNTWVRFLIQQVTGYLTGSVYRDYSLMKNGFPAENMVNGSVALVKTHEWGESVRRRFQQAVLLIRDPYGALLAEFNRRAGGHLGHATPEKYHKGKAWSHYVILQSSAWKNMVLDWLKFDGPLLVLRYEDMVSKLPAELSRLLGFLNITVSWPAFHCALRNREGIFQRSKKSLHFEPFTSALRKIVDGHKATVERALKLHEQGIKMDLENFTINDSLDKNQTQENSVGIVTIQPVKSLGTI